MLQVQKSPAVRGHWARPVRAALSTFLLAGLGASCSEPAVGEVRNQDLLIIGQDLDAYRGYAAAQIAPAPDGITQYLMFFHLSDPDREFGGLGLNMSGDALQAEVDWGGGPTNAWTATQISPGPVLAIGLSLAEHEHEGLEAGALGRVANGEYDREIDRLIQFARKTDKHILLRIGYEFEGAWNVGYHRTEDYRSAFIRIAEQIQSSDVSNVEFVWQSSASPIDDLIDGGTEVIENWYPGDQWVDWIGVSIFLPPDESPSVPTQFTPPLGRELLDEMLDFARARDKPVLVAEAAPQGFQLDRLDNAHIASLWDGPAGQGLTSMSAEEIWEAWYQPVFDYVRANDDVIDGFAYINADWDSQGRWEAPYPEGYWGDTRIELNQTIALRWEHAINQWRAE